MDAEDDIKKDRTIDKDRSILNRGWYICSKSGIHHLWKDGIVRNGAGSKEAFWPTKNEAKGFYNGWLCAV